MTKDLNSSDTDMQATDTLFADPLFDAATSITNTNDSVEHASREQTIMSHTARSMKNMLGRSPGRRQKNHRDRLGNPETMEVRTLLTESPVAPILQRAQMLQEVMNNLQQQLAQEDGQLTILQSTLQTARDRVDQLNIDVSNAKELIIMNTKNRDLADETLQSAQKSLDAVIEALNKAKAVLQKTSESTQLVLDLQAKITDSNNRIKAARAVLTEAHALLKKQPKDATLLKNYTSAREAYGIVVANEKLTQAALQTKRKAAVAQRTADAPALKTAKKNVATLEASLTKPTKIYESAFTEFQSASQDLIQAVESDALQEILLTDALANLAAAEKAAHEKQAIVQKLQDDITKKGAEASLIFIDLRTISDALLPPIDALSEPWDLTVDPKPLEAIEKRGATLATFTENFTQIMSTLNILSSTETTSFIHEARMVERGMMLSGSIEELMTTRELIIEPNTAVDTINPETLSRAPRAFASYTQTNARSDIHVQLRSPYDQTVIEFEDRINGGKQIRTETISHPGGTTDAVWNKMYERQTNGRTGEFFIRMYSDATKTVLLDTVSGLYNPDSNWIALDSQSSIETLGTKIVLALSSLGGTAVLQSWKGLQTTISHMQANDVGLSSHGSAFTLDLSGAEHLVTHVSFTVESDNIAAPITARFYRGTELIGLENVASGSLVDFSDVEGITSVLLTNAMHEMSQYARELMNYAQTADGKWQERRSAGGAAATYFSRNLHIPVASRSLILAEANAGYLPYDLSVSDLDISGNAYLPQVEADPLSRANNPDLSRAAHPYWGQSGDTLRRGGSPGYLAVGRFGPNVYGIRRDVNMFSVVNIKGLNGAAKINYVAYHTGDSDTRLSPEYYEIIGNTVVLKPGAPEQIVLYFGQENGNDPQGLNIDVEHRQSMTDENLLPPAGMSIRTDILAIRGPNVSEGVGPALSEIKDLGRPVTIGQGNVLMNVWNNGRTGGTVRVITNPGTPGAREKSFTLGGGEGKSVSMQFTDATGNLVIHVVLPDGTVISDGKTLKTKGDSDERRIAIKESSGTYRLLWVALNDPRPTVSDAPDYDAGFAAWKQTQIAKTGDTSLADPANFEKVFVTYLEAKKPIVLPEAPEALQKFVDEYGDTVTLMNRASLTKIRDDAIVALASAKLRGNVSQIKHFAYLQEAAEGLLNDMYGPKSDEWKAYIERTTSDPDTYTLIEQARKDAASVSIDSLMSEYEDTTLNSVPLINGQHIREDSVAGRIFLATYQKLLTLQDNQTNLMKKCAEIEATTGVNAVGLYSLVRRRVQGTLSDAIYIAKLQQMFKNAGFSGIFSNSATFAPINGIVTNVVNQQSIYTTGSVSIAIDRPVDLKNINSLQTYVSGVLLSQEVPLGSGPLTVNTSNTLVVNIPVEVIGQRMLDENFKGVIRVKVAVWLNEKEPNGELKHIGKTVYGVKVKWDGKVEGDIDIKDLSTLPPGSEHDRENIILSQIADPDHFVIRQPGEWRWTIGSEYHHDSAVHAADLNWGSLSDSDRGKDVYAPAGGIVKSSTVNETTGLTTLVIEHKHANGTVWYSKYLHMDNITLKANDTVTSDMKLGTVSDKGSSGQNHLHFEVLDEFFATVDMRKLLVNNFKMDAKAMSRIGTAALNPDGTQKKNADGSLKFTYTTNGAELKVDWNATLNRWQSSAQGLVYSRDEQAPGTPDDSGSSYWYAKEGTDVSKMARVVWDSRREFSQWYKYDPLKTDGWARNENNKRLLWDGTAFVPEL